MNKKHFKLNSAGIGWIVKTGITKIAIKPEDVYFTYCTRWFTWRYKEECKDNLIWIN